MYTVYSIYRCIIQVIAKSCMDVLHKFKDMAAQLTNYARHIANKPPAGYRLVLSVSVYMSYIDYSYTVSRYKCALAFPVSFYIINQFEISQSKMLYDRCGLSMYYLCV